MMSGDESNAAESLTDSDKATDSTSESNNHFGKHVP